MVEVKEPVVINIDGQKLFGILHRPLHQKKAPAVLMCHGLAGNKTGRFRLYVKLAKELAKKGIASLRIDFRGCGDSDGEFSESTVSGFMKDAHHSLQYLLQHEGIDANRIGFFGRSFGAAIAIWAATDYKNAKSLALWAPLFNTHQWQQQWQLFNEKSTPQHVKDQMLSVDGQMGSYEFFDEFFKLDLDSKLKMLHHVPLLHIHGIKDSTIGIHHADMYEDSRKKSMAPSKFIRLPEADHNFVNPSDQLKAIAETVDWFKHTLH